ncbi:MAG: 2-(1,2-epoxy-1,2-dihydrophenyl)acetyl-CoA isomerase [Ignavibacteriae bacterium]|nr:2-(1,2-epoxy-1,2-dihydrophenyl)acetyl-CoA isomerase [Ignavibacteriota bacterium]NOG98098.1 2-(1,2-epoxy-1,2-dihydrophenyl)acetyl-CoA isomerase [Ignavibacteriota bacterium]
MIYEQINYFDEGDYSIIQLNRPAVFNSFNKQMAIEFQQALTEAEKNKANRAILITGSGKAFCAGQDLLEAAPPGKELADLGKIIDECYNPIIKLIRSIEKPIVCAVNGIAAGAGANIALACDIVIAAESAAFLQAFSKIGLVPDSGGTYFLPRLVGLPRATALMMLGEKLSANHALAMGMIYKVFPDAVLEEESLKLTAGLAAMPTKALGLTKIALNESFNNNLSQQLDLEKTLQVEAGNTHDYKEGVQAFLEKRKPDFKGE